MKFGIGGFSGPCATQGRSVLLAPPQIQAKVDDRVLL